VEEIRIERGRVDGLCEGIAGMLELKFGDPTQPLIAEIQSIAASETFN
jgi:hypothetical protein